MKNPKNFFLIGPMASGKTTLGRLLAHTLNCPFYDVDKEIERSTGVTISWIFDLEGEAKFRQREEKMLDELTQRQGIVLATGGGAILSAINREKLATRGTVIYLKTSVEAQLQRTALDHTRPLLNTPNRAERLNQLALVREPLYAEIADWVYSTDAQTMKLTLKKILQRIQL